MAKMLEDIGCVAVMPLASLIGSGMGILNPWNLQLIIDKVEGAGARRCGRRHRLRRGDRDGARLRRRADEHRHRRGADPVRMARAMKLAVEAGREAFLAGRMPKKLYTRRALLAHRRKDRSEGRTVACQALVVGPSAVSSCDRVGPRRRSSARSMSCLPNYGIPFPARRFRTAAARWCWRSAPAWARPPLEIAKAHPEADFVAVEVHGPGVGSLLNRIERGQAAPTCASSATTPSTSSSSMVGDGASRRSISSFPIPGRRSAITSGAWCSAGFAALMGGSWPGGDPPRRDRLARIRRPDEGAVSKEPLLADSGGGSPSGRLPNSSARGQRSVTRSATSAFAGQEKLQAGR